MERALFIVVLATYMASGVRFYREEVDETTDLTKVMDGTGVPGKLRYVRVGEHRSVEIWQRGLSFDIRVIREL
ncbi:hypothetical protein [Kitasatospora sp. MBT66]|uniref:hypothetical protein n=1 Tax=Kitasatospora sp. MBT66 TaxID=1444769 RepID=UPI0005BCA531|nr:hypothetical protein [Kitasatospora sp. MBT66]